MTSRSIPNTVVLVHFCEQHGPSIVFTTQEIEHNNQIYKFPSLFEQERTNIGHWKQNGDVNSIKFQFSDIGNDSKDPNKQTDQNVNSPITESNATNSIVNNNANKLSNDNSNNIPLNNNNLGKMEIITSSKNHEIDNNDETDKNDLYLRLNNGKLTELERSGLSLTSNKNGIYYFIMLFLFRFFSFVLITETTKISISVEMKTLSEKDSTSSFPKRTNACESCSSLPSAQGLLSVDEEKYIISTPYPSPDSYSVVRTACVRSLSCEVCPGREGFYLFYFILFYFILFYFILFYFILFYFITYFFILFLYFV
jgi:hypothetical protein